MNGMLLNFIVALVVCLIGFKKYVWFLSVGYGLSVAAIGLEMLVKYLLIDKMSISWVTIAQLVLFVVYGIRLGGFLLIRELKNASYKKTLNEATKTKQGSSDKLPMPVMITMWISVAALYMVQTSPVFYRIKASNVPFATIDLWNLAGLLVSVLGVLIESISDKQKSAAKALNPKRFCDSGLFKMCRCPNYFGEILFWTGVCISSLNVYSTWYQWTYAIGGWVCILYIMLNGAKRLEKRQTAAYGSDPEFQAYVKKTPIIFPLIPLYSLKDSKFVK